MSTWRSEAIEEGLEALDSLDYDEPDSYARGNLYEVVVRFVVAAPNVEEAEAAVNEIIKEGKLKLLDEEDRDPVEEYDIEETCPAAI